MTKVIETYHQDGDQTYLWSSIEEAVNSGRFDYLYDEHEDFDGLIEDSEDLNDFIEKVGFPFFLG